MISITLPDPFLVIERWELSNHKEAIEHVNHNRGIYVLRDHVGDALYVGKSRRLYTRLRQHVIGRGDSARFNSYIATITLYPVNKMWEMDIYESYAIDTLRPIYNRDKVFYSGEHQTQMLYRSEELDGLIDLKRDVISDLKQRLEEPGETFAESDPEVTEGYELLTYGNILFLSREIEREKQKLNKLIAEKGVLDEKLERFTLQK